MNNLTGNPEFIKQQCKRLKDRGSTHLYIWTKGRDGREYHSSFPSVMENGRGEAGLIQWHKEQGFKFKCKYDVNYPNSPQALGRIPNLI